MPVNPPPEGTEPSHFVGLSTKAAPQEIPSTLTLKPQISSNKMNNAPKPNKDQNPPMESLRELPAIPDSREELESLGLDHLLPQRPQERSTRKHK